MYKAAIKAAINFTITVITFRFRPHLEDSGIKQNNIHSL